MSKKINDLSNLEANLKTVYGNKLKKTKSGSRKPTLDKLRKLLNRQLGRDVYGLEK